MGENLEVRGLEYEEKAEKKLKSWGILGSKYEDASDLLEKAGNSYKLAKAWDKAAAAYIKLADCQLKLESKHDAASAYVDAALCLKKKNPLEAVRCLEQAISFYLEEGRLQVAARHYKEIGEICENQADVARAMEYFDKAAELFQGEEVNSSSMQCKLKVAQFAAELEQYERAIDIFEVVASQSLNNNLLKYSVKGYLLNAALCQFCLGDSATVGSSLGKYQDLDPSFSSSKEGKFCVDLAATMQDMDIPRFTNVIKEYDDLSRLDDWKTTLLLRVKNKLKERELAMDDLT
ncbi:alpha-soluble NSF attachment protein 2 isoform X2 [Physcomitrium patens]|uniref:Alpha-soluble NSF attachment protein n=1 Tax=Physcomitrium patens TaxID=3218 RepID=A9T0Y9_PHYPA|nr:alpha-soluble NSF attachment protein 2-like isoform X2 [Physcomitrium patens]PNR35655.1 hypothetical protein PHYPA_021505 [Physcomitrium patens]|eukprot:XP_024400390.1 alpha-soluble NSF attachment protein 2-like isoform X2 [Physcomitrella patens]